MKAQPNRQEWMSQSCGVKLAPRLFHDFDDLLFKRFDIPRHLREA